MKNNKKNGVERLNEVIKLDKQINPDYIKDVIKSDFFYLINNYFEVDFADIKVEIDVDEQNKYKINLSTTGDRLKFMRTIPKD